MSSVLVMWIYLGNYSDVPVKLKVPRCGRMVTIRAR